MLRRALILSTACVAVLASGPPARSTLSAQEPAMADLLDRVAKYVAAYADPARIIYGEERYKHDFIRIMVNAAGGVEYIPMGGHEWVAEVAVAGSPADEPNGYPWLEFRDIVSLDGKPARDGASRLGMLATQEMAVAGLEAMTITRETAGSIQGRFSRVVFLPRLTFLFLHAVNQPRFSFRKQGEKKIEGIQTWEVKYQEKGAPTIIRSTTGKDAPCSGSFWIDPATGQVLMSTLKNGDFSALFDQMTVTYALDKATGLRLPATMQHETSDDEEGRRVQGKAKYAKWRVVARSGG